MKKIKVLVADDHPVYREGLSLFITNEADMEVVGQAGDGIEAVELAKKLVPDVAVLDVSMPGLNGIAAARQIKDACPDTSVLMVSGFGLEAYIIESLNAGAAGYLTKGTAPAELVSAIRSVHAGEAIFEFKSVKRLLSRLGNDKNGVKNDQSELHPRELEILKMSAKATTMGEIGKALSISERTVQTHMLNIFKKLEVGSRTEAVLHALKEGWLSMDDLP